MTLDEAKLLYLGKRCKLLVDQVHDGVRKRLYAGTIVKVVMVSRMGDLGITDNLFVDHGYLARVNPDDLEIIV